MDVGGRDMRDPIANEARRARPHVVRRNVWVWLSAVGPGAMGVGLRSVCGAWSNREGRPEGEKLPDPEARARCFE